MAMRKFVVHAGFHKTATTTVQKTLEQHNDLIAPHIEYLDRKRLKPVRIAAQAYSSSLDPVDLSIFEMRVCELLMTLDEKDDRCLLMSSEDFSGYLVGRHGVSTYAAAVPLVGAIKNMLRVVYDAEPNLSVYFSTRREGWHESCYGQLTKNRAIELSLQDFTHRYAEANNFNAIVSKVRSEISPSKVFAADLEDLTGRLGPLQPLLDLCELKPDLQSEITLLPPQNVARKSQPK